MTEINIRIATTSAGYAEGRLLDIAKHVSEQGLTPARLHGARDNGNYFALIGGDSINLDLTLSGGAE